MLQVSLRKIRISDKKYFAKWWRDKDLITLTSGRVDSSISDKKIEKYFSAMVQSEKDFHFMILAGRNVIGHIAAGKRRGEWYETQIVIGEKEYWSKGYGSRAIGLLLKRLHRIGIRKVYLEVRPTNTRAINAYEKCGFVSVRIIKYPKNKYLPRTLRMELAMR